MREFEPTLQDAKEYVDRVGAADLVVGIATYNNAEAIGETVKTVRQGLRRFFGDYRFALVNSDGGSSDGTPERFAEAAGEENVVRAAHPIYPVHKLTAPYHGLPGRGSAYRTIFAIARQLNAKACALVDADGAGMAPEWIERLVRPVVEQGFDLVAPYYQRHKYDGTLTNGIIYPLIRALYGKRVRQPMGFEFGLSAPFLEYCGRQANWSTDAAATATDVWLCARAACDGFRMCEAYLGPKPDRGRQPAAEVSSILLQVVGPLFVEAERSSAAWQKVRGSQPLPTFGPRFPVKADEVAVETTRLTEAFRKGSQDLREIWGLVLSPATLIVLKKLAAAAENAFVLKDELWVRSVYEFLLGHRQRVIARDHLVQALTPLYLGWTASMIRQVERAGPVEFERRLEDLCLAYEAQKPYLISGWRWPDRFHP
ncbi:MAG: glycosyltransferase [Bryobacteraceae bacterium]|nr:glycosyltransferase [Bryobacteraceae bacterium]